jgi:hypothetical protein
MYPHRIAQFSKKKIPSRLNLEILWLKKLRRMPENVQSRSTLYSQDSERKLFFQQPVNFFNLAIM